MESTLTYRYDNNGALGSITDSATGITYRYHYDLTDRLMRYTETGEDYEAIVRYIYNTQNELIQTRELIDGHSRYTVVSYDDDNRIDTWRTGYAKRIYGYDEYGRVVTRNTKHTYGTVSDVMVESYGYLVKDGRETSYVSSYRTDTVGDYDVTYTYTYDANGKITSVTDGENITTYVYDSAGQLLREDNQEAGKTWIYAYDNAGNILSKAEYAYTEGSLGEALDTATYTYGNSDWGDLLTRYDGRNITYTANGNPLNDGVWTYSWRHGRQLASMSDGTTTWNYTYDKDGLRLSRSNGTTTYNYVYLGGQLKRMTVGNVEIYFSYDSDGSPMSMVYNGTTYYYVKNLQGDVVGIVDKTGVQIASYSYDAWGNPLSVTSNTTANANAATIAERNPLRYRGYVYDTETGLYYLQSRYYNPEIGRFINADSLISTGGLLGHNMFAYCGNNPVIRYDPTGYDYSYLKNRREICPSEATHTYGGHRDFAAYRRLPPTWTERVYNYIYNDDETAVLEAEHFAFYKGQLVIKMNWKITNGRSGSFIIMFLNEETATEDTVKHEWGHFAQLMIMGLPDFVACVALPSVCSDPYNPNYYSSPWERTADLLGGVNRSEGYTPGSLEWGILQFIIGEISVPLYYIFGE